MHFCFFRVHYFGGFRPRQASNQNAAPQRSPFRRAAKDPGADSDSQNLAGNGSDDGALKNEASLDEIFDAGIDFDENLLAPAPPQRTVDRLISKIRNLGQGED